MPSITKEHSSDIDAIFKELNDLTDKYYKDPTKKELDTFRSMLYEIKEEIKPMIDGVNIESREQAQKYLKNSREVLYTIDNQRWLGVEGIYNDMQKTRSIIDGRIGKINGLIFNMDRGSKSNPIKKSEKQQELGKESKRAQPKLEVIKSLKAEGKEKEAKLLEMSMIQEEIEREKIFQSKYASLQSDLPSEEAEEASKKLNNLIKTVDNIISERPTTSYDFTTSDNSSTSTSDFSDSSSTTSNYPIEASGSEILETLTKKLQELEPDFSGDRDFSELKILIEDEIKVMGKKLESPQEIKKSLDRCRKITSSISSQKFISEELYKEMEETMKFFEERKEKIQNPLPHSSVLADKLRSKTANKSNSIDKKKKFGWFKKIKSRFK